MDDDGSATPANVTEDLTAELRREGYTMALYVAICLLGLLLALPGGGVGPHPILIIWGTTIGLAGAHWFAFRVSTRLIAAGRVRRADVALATAQLLGAAVVAVLATAGIAMFPDRAEILATQLLLASFVAVVGFVASRGGAGSLLRALGYAFVLFVAAVALALVKNALAGH